MAGKRYYWLKLQDGFFGSKRIKKLRNLAGGDTFTIIYLKMQLLAIKNEGVLEYTGLEDTFAEELALDIDEKPENVGITINYLLRCGLMETSDNTEFFLPYAVENTGSEGSSAQRVRNHRERKALQSNDCVTPVKQIGNGEKEIEKEIEKEKKKDSPTDYGIFQSVYNEQCKRLPKCKTMTEKRKKLVRDFLKAFSQEQWTEVCSIANASAFLCGQNDRGWKADIDFLLRTDKAAKILEGFYEQAFRTEKSGTGFETGNPFLEMKDEMNEGSELF